MIITLQKIQFYQNNALQRGNKGRVDPVQTEPISFKGDDSRNDLGKLLGLNQYIDFEVKKHLTRDEKDKIQERTRKNIFNSLWMEAIPQINNYKGDKGQIKLVEDLDKIADFYFEARDFEKAGIITAKVLQLSANTPAYSKLNRSECRDRMRFFLRRRNDNYKLMAIHAMAKTQDMAFFDLIDNLAENESESEIVRKEAEKSFLNFNTPKNIEKLDQMIKEFQHPCRYGPFGKDYNYAERLKIKILSPELLINELKNVQYWQNENKRLAAKKLILSLPEKREELLKTFLKNHRDNDVYADFISGAIEAIKEIGSADDIELLKLCFNLPGYEFLYPTGKAIARLADKRHLDYLESYHMFGRKFGPNIRPSDCLDLISNADLLDHYLNDTDPETLKYAIRAMGNFKDRRYIGQIKKYLYSNNEIFSDSALYALSRIVQPEDIELFIPLLKDKDFANKQQFYLYNSLRNIKGIKDISPFLHIFKIEHLDPNIKYAAAEAIGKSIGASNDIKKFDILRKFSQDNPNASEYTNAGIITAIGELGDRKYIPILEPFLNNKDYRAAIALSQIGSPEDVKLLKSYLTMDKTKNKREIQAAIKAIGAIGLPNDIELIKSSMDIRWLDDRRHYRVDEIREIPVEAIANLGTSEHIEFLKSFLENSHSSDFEVAAQDGICKIRFRTDPF